MAFVNQQDDELLDDFEPDINMLTDPDQFNMFLQTYGLPRIIGPAPTPSFAVEPSQAYLEPESVPCGPEMSSQGQYLATPSSQFQFDPNLGQNYLASGSQGQAFPGQVSDRLEAPIMSRGSSFQSLPIDSNSNSSPYDPGELSPLENRGSFSSQTRPVMSSPSQPVGVPGSNPTPSPYNSGQPSSFGARSSFSSQTCPIMSTPSQPVRNIGSPQNQLNALIQIIETIRQMIYVGCPFPSYEQLLSALLWFREGCSIIENLTQSGPEQAACDENKQYQCLLCRPSKIPLFKNRGTFVRHVTSKHHPAILFYCPHGCDPRARPDDGWFTRRDKHLLHMRHKHKDSPVDREVLERYIVEQPAPNNCPICGKPVDGWQGFWDCLYWHCSISDSGRRGSNGDDSDRGDDDGDNGNDGGNKYYSSPNNGTGYLGGSSNGPQYNPFGGDHIGGPSSWGGTAPCQYYGASNDPCVPSDLTKSGGTGDASGPCIVVEPKVKQPFADIDELGDSKSNPLAKWFNGDTRVLETFRSEVCLRFKTSDSKNPRGLGKRTTVDENKELESASVKSKISQELYRVKYLEFRIFEDQKHGSLLTYAHETLVISQPGDIENIIVSSMHEILYQTVEIRSAKRPEIPGDCLIYLAKEKDHRSAEANLEATRQAPPRKRGHLRVRVKAIAGVLALRAAVSKTAVAVNNTEATGDGWELGIPLPAPEEMAKVFAWLIQVLMFFLRAPPNIKVLLMLENDCLEVPTLDDGMV